MEIVQKLVLDSVVRDNILPLTSRCNMACIFCSHKNNPKDIEVYRIPDRTIDEVQELIEYLDPCKKIIIGESATKIIEGEPLLYKSLETVLAMIREKYPKTKIQITTNGIRLNSRVVSFLEEIGNIELVLSLNSSSTHGREILMNDKQSKDVLHTLSLLKHSKIELSGSIVALPFKVGYVDIQKTIAYLMDIGAKNVRVFLPGYSKLANKDLQFCNSLHIDLAQFVNEMSLKYKNPVTLEPPLITTLDSYVQGITNKKHHDFISHGDIILEVNGQAPFSRVHCHELITKAVNPVVKIAKRDGQFLSYKIIKGKGESAGIVFDYDVSYQKIELLEQKITRSRSLYPVILTSGFAYNTIKMALEKKGVEVDLLKVNSIFFGGSIQAAGLITVEDYLVTIKELTNSNHDLIIVPAISFDRYGKDLLGKHYLIIQEELGCKIELI